MDYGKLAYLKAEDLELRLMNLDFDNESNSAYITASVGGAGGVIPLAVVSGDGNIGFVVKIATVDSANKKISLLCDGLVVGEGYANNFGEVIIIGSANISESAEIALSCQEDTFVIKAEAVFFGNAYVSARAIEVSACGADSVAAVITSNLGKICLTIADAEMLAKGIDPIEGNVLGAGERAAVCKGKNGFIAAYCGGKDICIQRLDKEGFLQKTLRVRCESEPTSVCVAEFLGRTVVGYVAKGKVCYRVADGELNCISEETKTSVSADKVLLCGKNALFLVYSYRGKCFLKQYEEEIMTEAFASLVADIQISYEGVSS